MFNRWKPYPKYKPSTKGWYQCSIRYGTDQGQAYVMDLYYYPDIDQWRDNRVQHIVDSYEVFGYGKRNERHQIQTCLLSNRNDVIAFKKLPRIYK